LYLSIVYFIVDEPVSFGNYPYADVSLDGHRCVFVFSEPLELVVQTMEDATLDSAAAINSDPSASQDEVCVLEEMNAPSLFSEPIVVYNGDREQLTSVVSTVPTLGIDILEETGVLSSMESTFSASTLTAQHLERELDPCEDFYGFIANMFDNMLITEPMVASVSHQTPGGSKAGRRRERRRNPPKPTIKELFSLSSFFKSISQSF
jgi:hypothetical protein